MLKLLLHRGPDGTNHFEDKEFTGGMVRLAINGLTNGDHPIFEFCTTEKYPVFRGSINDLGVRLFAAVKYANVKKFIRICGDSPFIAPDIIDRAILLSKISDFDIGHQSFSKIVYQRAIS